MGYSEAKPGGARARRSPRANSDRRGAAASSAVQPSPAAPGRIAVPGISAKKEPDSDFQDLADGSAGKQTAQEDPAFTRGLVSKAG